MSKSQFPLILFLYSNSFALLVVSLILNTSYLLMKELQLVFPCLLIFRPMVIIISPFKSRLIASFLRLLFAFFFSLSLSLLFISSIDGKWNEKLNNNNSRRHFSLCLSTKLIPLLYLPTAFCGQVLFAFLHLLQNVFI